jgi:BolA family transcriptional regulator, general stress-responsive regulator
MVHPDRIALIRERLTAALAPQRLEIVDESHKHAGHPGARGGGGHFKVLIVSESFADKGLLQRHRMVFDALGGAMHSEIHALSIQAYTPNEAPAGP